MIANKFKRILLTAILSFSLFLSFIGCEDDPPVAYQETDTISTLITGVVVLRPYVDFISYITPIYGEGMDIDSMKFGDTLCNLFKNYTFVFGNNFQYQSVYFNQADSLNYSSGDNVNIKIFMANETINTHIKLLNFNDDVPLLDSSTLDTVVSIGQDINLVWHPVPNADWYGIFVHLKIDADSSKEYLASTTTPNFTLDGNYHNLNSDYTVLISAVTGPVPNIDSPNVFGSKITGSLYSRTKPVRHEIRVGNGASKVSSKLIDSMNNINYDSEEFFNKLIEHLQK